MRRHILRAELALLLAAQENWGSLLCSPIDSFLPAPTIHVQAVLWVWGKAEPCCLNTSFWIKGWAASQLVEMDFALWCGSRRQGSGRSERVQDTDMLPCGPCPAHQS